MGIVQSTVVVQREEEEKHRQGEYGHANESKEERVMPQVTRLWVVFRGHGEGECLRCDDEGGTEGNQVKQPCHASLYLLHWDGVSSC